MVLFVLSGFGVFCVCLGFTETPSKQLEVLLHRFENMRRKKKAGTVSVWGVILKVSKYMSKNMTFGVNYLETAQAAV